MRLLTYMLSQSMRIDCRGLLPVKMEVRVQVTSTISLMLKAVTQVRRIFVHCFSLQQIIKVISVKEQKDKVASILKIDESGQRLLRYPNSNAQAIQKMTTIGKMIKKYFRRGSFLENKNSLLLGLDYNGTLIVLLLILDLIHLLTEEILILY